ncbi:hypothetical protein PG996_013132 [Apiospora saccharicola]|uniref:Uncharacterized protein n=1 Tax=Apiospora saccharicola TaxID=335842 RepID=A0ABR1U4K4_9PEZI
MRYGLARPATFHRPNSTVYDTRATGTGVEEAVRDAPKDHETATEAAGGTTDTPHYCRLT